ncbi:hypothetical protein [Jatrophihabitans fulvus]
MTRTRFTRRPIRRSARLAAELAEYRSQAELTELAALLDRYSDDETQKLRELVDWTRAA